jgi:membrane-associated phospholipid phosphatase
MSTSIESPPPTTNGQNSMPAEGPIQRTAHALGYILHPAVLMVLAILLLSARLRHNALLTLMDMGILVAGLFPGLLYVYVKTRRGDFGHYHLLLKEERRIALPLVFVGLVGSFVLYALTGAPAIMMRCEVVGLVVGAGAMIISRFWKISLHATIAMGCAALFMPISPSILLVMAVVGILVGISRLVVKHHTPAQVIGGWLYGFGVTGILVWLLVSPLATKL